MRYVTVLVLAVSAALVPALAAPLSPPVISVKRRNIEGSGTGQRRSDILQMRQTSDMFGPGLVDKGDTFAPGVDFNPMEDFSIGSVVKIAEGHA